MKSNKILVIAYDAGGAEIIAAYLKAKMKQSKYVAYVGGPAAGIFERENIAFNPLPHTRTGIRYMITNQCSSVSFVLLGIGWKTKIELTALEEAKRSKLRTVVYMDSWSFYCKKHGEEAGHRHYFGYPEKGWRNNLPDELWVGDRYALAIEKKYFPDTRIKVVPNEYFKKIIAEYRLRQTGTPRYEVLFVGSHGDDSFSVFSEIAKQLSTRTQPPSILLRLHPAESSIRYRAVINKYAVMSIVLSEETDLLRDLARAHAVVGTVTVAMVAALLIKKKTISIATKGRKIFIPYPGLVKVTSVRAATQLL